MPQERGYEQQTTPQAAAPMPLANADVYGAQLGGALEQAAGQRHQENLRDYQIKRRLTADREQMDAGHKTALLRSDMDDVTNTLRTNPTTADYQDHVAKVMEAYDAQKQGILDGITDDAVRNNTAQQLDAYGLSLKVQETTFVEGQRTAKAVGDFQKTTEVGANRIQTQATADDVMKAYAQELVGGVIMLDGLQHVTSETHGKLELEMRQGAATAALNRLNDLDPHRAEALIDKGAFNDSGLTHEQLAVARNGAQVEIRRLDAQAAQAVAAAKAKFTDDLEQTKKQIANGVTDANQKLPELRARADALGDKSAVEDIDGLAADGMFNKEFESQTPVQRQERLNALLKLPHPNEAQQREIHWHQTTGKSLTSDFNTDTVTWMGEHAPINAKPPSLTEGLQARADWSRRTAPLVGRPPDLLSRDEAANLRAKAAVNAQGRLDVANMIADLDGTDARRTAAQVAPDDAILRQMVTLPPGDRALVQNGEAARKNKAIIDGVNAAPSRTVFQTSVGDAMMAFDPAQYEAAYEVSRSIYAADAFKAGEPDYLDSKYRPYVERGLGGKIGAWHGDKVLLKAGYTDDLFHASLNRYVPPKAGPLAPTLPNGTILTGDQLRQYRPVLRPDGDYEFRDSSGGQQVKNRAGQIFRVKFPDRTGK